MPRLIYDALTGNASVSRAMSLPDHSARSSVLIVSSTSRPCCRAVRVILARIAHGRALSSLRLPPVFFRITTAGRIARSAALFVLSTSFVLDRSQPGSMPIQSCLQAIGLAFVPPLFRRVFQSMVDTLRPLPVSRRLQFPSPFLE